MKQKLVLYCQRGKNFPEFTVFLRKIVRLGREMYHISANLELGRRENDIWGYKYKKLQGRQKGYKRAPDEKVSLLHD